MCNFKNAFILLLYFGFSIAAFAQNDSSQVKIIPEVTSGQLNMDATYNRPFLQAGKMPIAIGGYLEANTQYVSTDGISDGFSFQFRRTNLFFSSTIAKKIRFFSELEFEDGTKEINLEAAFIDFEFNPLLNLRGGIIVNPIGAFNQNHDGPRWDFIDRPISATTVLPATLSNVGFGLLGKYFVHNWTVGYEAYLTNGFDDHITANEENRTSLAAGKLSPEKFEESNSGSPMFTGKLAIRNRRIGELGFSYMTGIYNKWKADGFVLDRKRSIDVFAIDYTVTALRNKLNITGEAVKVFVDVPDTYSQAFGSEQLGAFIDIVGTVIQRPMLGWEKSKINLALRMEYSDYNQGKFKETNGNIGDDIWAVVPGIAFRPVGTTVVRFNYRYQQQRDLLGNPPSKTAIIQFGISSYF